MKSPKSPTNGPDDDSIIDRFVRGREGVHLTGTADLALISKNWQITPVDEAAEYRGYFKTWHHDRLLVTRAQGGEVRFRRGLEHLGDEYDEYVQIGVVHDGLITASQGERTETFEGGEVLAIRLAEPFLSTTSGETDVTLLYVPTDALEERGINTRRLSLVPVRASPVVAALGDLLEHAFTMPVEEARRLGPVLVHGIMALVAGVLTLADDTDHGDGQLSRSSVRQRAIDLIEANFSDPDFSVDNLATRLGASRRYLYLLFEDDEHQVATRIRTRRLLHAAMLLRSPAGRSLSVAKVARASGHRGSGAFTRAFRSRFGMSPAAYRDRIDPLPTEGPRSNPAG